MQDYYEVFKETLTTSITAAAILAFLGYLFRSTLNAWLLGRIQATNKEKLTQLESQLERERTELSDLRSIVITGTRDRNKTLMEKQVVAAETLWLKVQRNNAKAMATKSLQVINIREMDLAIANNDNSSFIDVLTKTSGIEKLLEEASEAKGTSAGNSDSARLFVSPMAWALYSAHSSIIWHAVLTLVCWKNGATTKLLKNQELIDLTKKALPHQSAFLDEHGVSGTYFVVEELEEAILKELRRFVFDGKSDKNALSQAEAIIKASKVFPTSRPPKPPPDS